MGTKEGTGGNKRESEGIRGEGGGSDEEHISENKMDYDYILQHTPIQDYIFLPVSSLPFLSHYIPEMA